MISDRIYDDIPPQMKILNMVIPILMHFCIKLERFKPQKAVCHPTICDVIYTVKIFPTICRRIYCHKLFILSNQTLHYKIKCIRIIFFFSSLCLAQYCLLPFPSTLHVILCLRFIEYPADTDYLMSWLQPKYNKIRN